MSSWLVGRLAVFIMIPQILLDDTIVTEIYGIKLSLPFSFSLSFSRDLQKNITRLCGNLRLIIDLSVTEENRVAALFHTYRRISRTLSRESRKYIDCTAKSENGTLSSQRDAGRSHLAVERRGCGSIAAGSSNYENIFVLLAG